MLVHFSGTEKQFISVFIHRNPSVKGVKWNLSFPRFHIM